MSRKIYIYNENLKKDQRLEDPIMDIYNLNDDDLLEHGWLYNNLYPNPKMEILIRKVRKVNPLLIKDNPKFWDQGLNGYDVYNHAIGELSQVEGLEH